ncbi:MAG TPA: anti-sigma factor [Hyphomicrobiaceae bacterium]|nr:anti-sigma factor [Hyphomicrobiaceae bacterium]
MMDRPLKEAELHAFVDGELNEASRADVSALLKDAPAEAKLVQELAALNDAIRQRYAYRLEEPVPDAITTVMGRLSQSRRPPWRSWPVATAAGIAMALAAGVAGYGLRGYTGSPGGSEPAFVATAIGAHAVYVPEVRHPVEVSAAEEKHLVQWLTKRVGAELHAPALAPMGWKLVGGRLLPDHGRPAAQFMYENSAGRRLTLYITRAPGLSDTSFRFVEQGEFSAFYWVDRPLAYALAGRLKRDELSTIARTVYSQLDLGPALPDQKK